MKINFLPIILAAVGTYFLIKLRFFFILHPVRTVNRGLRAVKDKRALKAFCLALAGTLGVGNVFGVAIGLIIGGAGSLFWLFVSMLFAMVIKYAEVVISSDNLFHDADTHGGFFYVIRMSFKRLSVPMSYSYAFLTLSLSLILGASLQIGAITESLSSVMDFSPRALGSALSILILLAIIGGARKIEKVTAVIIPLTTVIYIISTLGIILLNINKLGDVIENIFISAFTPKSAIGGGVGFLFSAPVREGFSRGILSNEAGAGTSAIAHSRSGILSPATAGVLGIFEVWFDTGLICMLTGLSILLSIPDISVFSGGMELIMYAVGSAYGAPGKYTVIFCVFAFAFATVICWYYYGSESFSQLFDKRYRAVFIPVFISFAYLGCFADSFALVIITDILMSLATILTLSALIKNSDRIKHLSESGGVIDSDINRLRPFGIKGNVFSKAAKRR